MIDGFVLLTPILLLAVIGLLRFVGCNPVFGLEPTVAYEPPVISSISPTSVIVCGPAFELTVTGTDFQAGHEVQWSDASRATTFVSSTELRASIPANDITELKTVNVTVKDPTNAKISNPQALTVTFGTPDIQDFSSLPSGVINFDPVVDGQVPDIHFAGWIWYQDTPNQGAVYFDDPMATTRSFTFVSVSRIVQTMLLRHYDPTSPTDITITVTDETGQAAPPMVIKGGQYKTLITGWMRCSKTVTFTLSPGSFNVGIVVLNTYLGAA
jgi:hypothetical protein